MKDGHEAYNEVLYDTLRKLKAIRSKIAIESLGIMLHHDSVMCEMRQKKSNFSE